MKQKTANRINVIFWIAMTIVFMNLTYKTWSQYGLYTVGSFCVSLFIDGGICAVFGWFVSQMINQLFERKNNVKEK